jgi:phosphoribosyl 1,2-cyclic phosphodiesterase
LIDLGFSIRETIRRLELLGVEPERIHACLVTHEHSDHLSGVRAFAEKFGKPVYLTEGTRRAWAVRHCLDRVTVHTVDINQTFRLGDVDITPVPVPHDAREPVQYTFTYGSVKLGVLTDLGMVTPAVCRAYEECTALLVEANHDLTMLRNGGYPASLKRRVAGDWGHLNNDQTADLVRTIAAKNLLTHLIVGHISQQNNHPDQVALAIEPAARGIQHIHYASQDSGLDWIDLNPV